MSNNNKIILKNGKDGTDGNTPQMGVKEDGGALLDNNRSIPS